MGIQIDLDKCIGCGDCVPVCPFDVLEIVNEKVQVKDGCNLCGACQEVCNYSAIFIEDVSEKPVTSDSHRGIWIFAEQRGNRLNSVAYELLSKGRELADSLRTELCAICFGYNVDGVEQLIAYGADKVYLADSPALVNNQEDLYTRKLVELHGGRMWVESEGEGRGSTFSFFLPLWPTLTI